MQAAIFKTAIEFAKNKTVQRTAIGFVVGAAVGFAIAKTVEPYLFPEVEYEMIPPYDTPEQALVRDELGKIIPLKYDGVSVGHVTSMDVDETGVRVTARINPDALKGNTDEVTAGEEVANRLLASVKPKYAKPVRTAKTHAAAVPPTVEPATGSEKLAALNTPAPKPVPTKTDKPVGSTFSSIRGETPSTAGGGNPHKKARPFDDGQ